MKIKAILVTFALFLIIIPAMLGQNKNELIAFGKLKVEWGNLDSTRIRLYRDGKLIDTYHPSKNGKFEFQLVLNYDYMFWFEKKGYVTKKVSFNTLVPTAVTSDPEFIPFPDFDFYVTLFKSYPEVDTMFFQNPVGKIRYSADINDFDWDKDYTLQIIKRMEEIEKNIKEKHERAEKARKEKEKNKNKQKPKEEPEPQLAQESDENISPVSVTEKNTTGQKITNATPLKKTHTAETSVTKSTQPASLAPSNSNKPTDTNNKSTSIPANKPALKTATINQPANLSTVHRSEQTQGAGKKITRTKVTRGNVTLVYIKVEYSWGGPFYFIQDEVNAYRNISGIFYNKMISDNNNTVITDY